MEQPSHCLNCGAELQGPYCHSCGQPVKGMVRQLRSVLHDFLDTVLEYDSRIWRTLLPLYLRPGRITVDFLAGRRMRFVSPFRLFFVLTVVTFLALQLLVEAVPQEVSAAASAIQSANSVAEVNRLREEALADLTQAQETLAGGEYTAAAAAALAASREEIERAAAQQTEWLREVQAARAAGVEPPLPPTRLSFNGELWDPETNPLVISWLPDFANDLLNRWIGRAQQNIERARDDPGRLVEAFLGLLPAALFVLMPLFALLLAIFYVGKRWLYTAHLVVALHSHSFLAIALLFSVLLSELAGVLARIPWAAYPVRTLAVASQLWIPVYLVLMQRRVYAQGWPMTLFKFAAIGSVYSVILIIAVSVAALVSLVVA